MTATIDTPRTATKPGVQARIDSAGPQLAAIAVEKLPKAEGNDVAFYKGKIASAQFFAKNVLPASTLARKMVEASSLDIMELEEEVF